MNILLTGYTGNLGGSIAECLQNHRVLALVREPDKAAILPHVQLIEGSLKDLPDAYCGRIDAIIHAAADTSFRASSSTLDKTNTEGTANLLEFASRCPGIQRFLHVSTVCVSGCTTGLISETALSPAPAFVNEYERTKWNAEQLVMSSSLPWDIVRPSIVLGAETDGRVPRLGAIHQTIYWLWRGLIPLMPGQADTPVDIISIEHAARTIAQVIEDRLPSRRIVHAASDRWAPTLGELLDAVFTIFAGHSPAWKRGAIERPVLSDAKTWSLFRSAVKNSGDAVFSRILSDAQTFLPGLLHPRVYVTSREAFIGWRGLIKNVVTQLVATDWYRNNG